jgi:hypothetical protein
VVLAAALTDPKQLGLPFGSWTLDRLQAYLNEPKGIPILGHDRLQTTAFYLNFTDPHIQEEFERKW